MQHTLIAVFDNRSDAQKAMDELLQCGFARDEVRLSEDRGIGSGQGAGATRDEGITDKVRHFFSDMFGATDSVHTEKYATAISQGHHVLTVTADDEPEIERAADVVERFGPVDIDEKAAEWAGGAPVARSEAMRMSGAGGMQQAQGASLQSHGDRNLFQQQSLNEAAPMGTTYQEPMEDTFTLNVPNAGSRQGGSAEGVRTQDSQQRDTSAGGAVSGAGRTAIPVVQEQLRVGKRDVQRGGVRVFSRIVETPVDQSIGLREEHVNVERHAVDQPISTTDPTAFKEQTIEMRESAEEAVVEKSARVVEEVVVGKEVSERQETIHGTVRHTEVEIERLGAGTAMSGLDDDSYYRSHWTSTYGASGGNYDEYAPAYSYGRDMHNTYRGRQWTDVEPDVRTQWETKGGGGASTWDKFKAAIRHGWDRITD